MRKLSLCGAWGAIAAHFRIATNRVFSYDVEDKRTASLFDWENVNFPFIEASGECRISTPQDIGMDCATRTVSQ